HSYHGATVASAAFTGDPRRWFAEQARCTVQGVRFAPDCYCYRCPFGMEYPSCNVQCARYLDYMIKEEGNVAAIIVEPVVGTNGRLVPPPEYFPLNWDVTPDILTTAKGATGAYTPAGITAATEKVADFFEQEVFCHGHTYAFHPIALCAIPAAVSEYKKLMASGLPQKTAPYLKEKNRKTKEPFNVKAEKFAGGPLMTGQIAANAMQNGLYMAAWYDTLVIAPPLIITEEEIDQAMDRRQGSREYRGFRLQEFGIRPGHGMTRKR
ncbi:MAG: hypothetical protein B1H13_14960, partial [Desulfobacteraceae bacterium 4484_190.3]